MATILKRKYTVTNASGKTVTKTCKHYSIQYFDGNGKRKWKKGYVDRQATMQLAARLEKAIARGAEGLEDPFAEHKGRAVSGHLEEYIADLKAGGLDDEYVRTAERRITRLVDECGWGCLNDIEPNSFIRWRDREANDEGPRKARLAKKGAAATTLNQYLDAARAFTNWCASNGRMPGVPITRTRRGKHKGGGMMALALASVTKVSGEKRRKRRSLSDEEIVRVLAAAPADRAVVYRFGLSTGLRRQEIADLRWGDVHLNAISPYVALRPEANKARRDDERVPLPQSLAEDLRKARGDAKDNARVFPDGVPCMDTWRADLAAAKIDYKDANGRQLDFHGGTRKTLNTRMSKGGMGLAERMRRMRVTDARLVNDTYLDAEQLGLDEPIAELLPTAPAVKPATAAQ